MKEWSNGEVLGWLTHRFGFWGQQYVPMFSNKQVDGKRLSELTAEDLKTEFGVTKPLHLVRMCRDIKDASRPIHQINLLIAPLVIDYIQYLMIYYKLKIKMKIMHKLRVIEWNSFQFEFDYFSDSILAHSISIGMLLLILSERKDKKLTVRNFKEFHSITLETLLLIIRISEIFCISSLITINSVLFCLYTDASKMEEMQQQN